jgi:hypothetical protein
MRPSLARLTIGIPQNGNEKPDKEDERDDDGEVFSPLFVAETLLVAALTLSLREFIPFFEVECHWWFLSMRGTMRGIWGRRAPKQ